MMLLVSVRRGASVLPLRPTRRAAHIARARKGLMQLSRRKSAWSWLDLRTTLRDFMITCTVAARPGTKAGDCAKKVELTGRRVNTPTVKSPGCRT